MENRKKFTLPWHLVVFDLVGAVLFAIGLFLYISEDRGIYLILAGVLLMMPLVLHILNFAKQIKK